ncbi:MAG TPA: hypothetical protein PK413_19310, partial [Thermoanaerobaculia bacterium]|nr:hypothetical protein [Thermoanaerobaculia bacterium]
RLRQAGVAIVQVLLLVGFLALWQLVTVLGWVDPFIISQPSQIAAKLTELIGDGSLGFHIAVTVAETLAGFLMDTAMYYMGIVTPAYENVDALRTPIFSEDILPTRLAYAWMSFYNRRLIRLARLRRRLGIYGRKNEGWHHFVTTATLGRTGGLPMLRSGMKVWLKAELATFWQRFRSRPTPKAMAVPAGAST